MERTTKKTRSKIAKKTLALRNSLWPALKEDEIWDRQVADGWLSVPRAMPLILRTMDELSEKGKPVSSVYLELWFRTYDNSFVIASKHREMAFGSGFSGQRAIRTWIDRMKILEGLGFISIESGPSGSISYVLILNPYHVIKRLYESGKSRIQKDTYNTLNARMIEIGAEDWSPIEDDVILPISDVVSPVKTVDTASLLKKE